MWFNDSEFSDEDGSIYSYDAREQLLDDDELTPGEAGFMKGYDEADEEEKEEGAEA